LNFAVPSEIEEKTRTTSRRGLVAATATCPPLSRFLSGTTRPGLPKVPTDDARGSAPPVIAKSLRAWWHTGHRMGGPGPPGDGDRSPIVRPSGIVKPGGRWWGKVAGHRRIGRQPGEARAACRAATLPQVKVVDSCWVLAQWFLFYPMFGCQSSERPLSLQVDPWPRFRVMRIISVTRARLVTHLQVI
jgi:hypothetical protein